MTAIHVSNDGDDLGNFEMEGITNSDAYLIENAFGLTVKGFIEGIGEMRASAVDALLWLMYRRQGRVVDKASVRWSLGGLKIEPVEDEPDPTVASSGDADATGSEPLPISAI